MQWVGIGNLASFIDVGGAVDEQTVAFKGLFVSGPQRTGGEQNIFVFEFGEVRSMRCQVFLHGVQIGRSRKHGVELQAERLADIRFDIGGGDLGSCHGIRLLNSRRTAPPHRLDEFRSLNRSAVSMLDTPIGGAIGRHSFVLRFKLDAELGCGGDGSLQVLLLEFWRNQ